MQLHCLASTLQDASAKLADAVGSAICYTCVQLKLVTSLSCFRKTIAPGNRQCKWLAYELTTSSLHHASGIQAIILVPIASTSKPLNGSATPFNQKVASTAHSIPITSGGR